MEMSFREMWVHATGPIAESISNFPIHHDPQIVCSPSIMMNDWDVRSNYDLLIMMVQFFSSSKDK